MDWGEGGNSFDERSDDEEVVEKKSTKAFPGRKVPERSCQVEEMRALRNREGGLKELKM